MCLQSAAECLLKWVCLLTFKYEKNQEIVKKSIKKFHVVAFVKICQDFQISLRKENYDPLVQKISVSIWSVYDLLQQRIYQTNI
jgi:hypothetical protein